MPKSYHDQLMKAANKYAKQGKLRKKKGDTTKQAKDRFVYGRMRATGRMK